MTIIEEIYMALLLARPDDLKEFEKYIRWILVRRQINQRFYFSAHWVQHSGPRKMAPSLPAARAHWIR